MITDMLITIITLSVIVIVSLPIVKLVMKTKLSRLFD